MKKPNKKWISERGIQLCCCLATACLKVRGIYTVEGIQFSWGLISTSRLSLRCPEYKNGDPMEQCCVSQPVDVWEKVWRCVFEFRLHMRGKKIPLQPWNMKERRPNAARPCLWLCVWLCVQASVHPCMSCTKTSGLVTALRLSNWRGGEWKQKNFIKANSLHRQILSVGSWLSCWFCVLTVCVLIWLVMGKQSWNFLFVNLRLVLALPEGCLCAWTFKKEKFMAESSRWPFFFN